MYAYSTESHSFDTRRDPLITISSVADQVVIGVQQRLDVASTETVISAAVAAVGSGMTVMIDLDPSTPSDTLIGQALHAGGAFAEPLDVGPVTVLGPGVVRFPTCDGLWMIDLTNRRLCRSARRIDPRFVVPERWTHIRAVWATCAKITVLTIEDSYLSTSTRWTEDAKRRATRSPLPVPRGSAA